MTWGQLQRWTIHPGNQTLRPRDFLGYVYIFVYMNMYMYNSSQVVQDYGCPSSVFWRYPFKGTSIFQKHLFGFSEWELVYFFGLARVLDENPDGEMPRQKTDKTRRNSLVEMDPVRCWELPFLEGGFKYFFTPIWGRLPCSKVPSHLDKAQISRQECIRSVHWRKTKQKITAPLEKKIGFSSDLYDATGLLELQILLMVSALQYRRCN